MENGPKVSLSACFSHRSNYGKTRRKNKKGNAAKAFPFSTNCLERELQSELDESRAIDSAGYLAEAAVAQACVRWPKLRAVEDVKKFRPEFEVELIIRSKVCPLK